MVWLAGRIINHGPETDRIPYGARFPTVHQMREFFRKLVHIAFGLGIAALIWFTPESTALPLLMTGTFAGIIFRDALVRGYRIPLISDLIDNLERENVRPGKGALYFALSSLFCLVLFPKEVVVPAIITLSVLDGAATLVGYYYGRHPVVGNKTAEGSLAGVTAAVFFLLPFVPPFQAVVVSVIAGLTELLSPVDDNLTIPVVVCIALTLLAML